MLVVSFGLYTQNMIEIDMYLEMVVIILIATTLIDMLLSIGLTVTFFNKLWMLGLNMDYIGKQNANTLDTNQMKIMKIISKLTILSITESTFYQILIIFFAVTNAMKIFDSIPQNVYRFQLRIASILWALEVMMISICVFLSFDAAHFWFSLFCGRTHKCLSRCCASLAKKRMKRQLQRQQSLSVPLLAIDK